MKLSKVIFVFLLILMGSSKLFAWPPGSDKEKIMSILRYQESAWNNSNIDSFMLFYWNSPELRFVSKNGIRKGWQEVYDNYRQSNLSKGSTGTLTYSVTSLDMINSSNALLIGTWIIRNNTGAYKGNFTLWVKKINRKWLIILDHTS